MKIDRFLQAALLGIALIAARPDAAGAETLQVMSGSPSGALNVPMNRAVVVESDTPFTELSIANPNIADISTLSDRTIYVLGKAPGRTTLTLLGPDGRLITNVEVQVAPDIGEFKERLQQILPGEKIEVRTANDGIVLSGVVSSIIALDRALDLANRYAPEKVSNLMSVGGTQQVMLKVRFAEMSRSVSKSLSSSLAVRGDGSAGGVLGTGQFTKYGNIDRALDGDVTTGVNSSNSSEGQFTLGFNAGGLEFAVLLEALESKGVVRTLAEPNLTALSGQEASFLAGGEYPIPVVGSDGQVTIEYKPFGVELKFTPRVVDGDIINLEMKAAVSGIDSTVTFNNQGILGFGVPAPRDRDHGRDARRRELRHRRPSAGRLPGSHRAGAVAGRHPDPRRPVPLGQLRAQPVRTGHHRHPAPRDAASRRGAGVADRPGPAADRGRPVPARQDRRAEGCRRRGRAAGLQRFLRLRDGVRRMTPRSTILLCASALALSACGDRSPFDSWTHEAGSFIDEGGFGNPTKNNALLQSGQSNYVINLNQRFASDVPTMVNFAFNSAILDATARGILDRQANWIRQFPEVRFKVFGHTDLVGSNGYNKALGLRRARTVVAYLSSRGISTSRLEAVVSYGETQPLIVTQDPERRNRRTITEVSGFVSRNPALLNGKYAEVIHREYVASATEASTKTEAATITAGTQ